MGKQKRSKCLICNKMCEYTDEGTKGEGWSHIKEQGHPPFVALEHTKEEADKEYREWKGEFRNLW